MILRSGRTTTCNRHTAFKKILKGFEGLKLNWEKKIRVFIIDLVGSREERKVNA